MFYFLCVVTVVLLTVKQAMLHQTLFMKNKDDHVNSIYVPYCLLPPLPVLVSATPFQFGVVG